MTKRYVGAAIMFVVAALFVIFSLVAWSLSKGDLSAIIEFTIPRRRRRYGEPAVVSYPAYVSINAGLSAATPCAFAVLAIVTAIIGTRAMARTPKSETPELRP